MSGEHTPGPWHIGDVAMLDRDTDEMRPDPHHAYVHNDGAFEVEIQSADAMADAHLISAAPDMLSALIKAECFFQDDFPDGVDGSSIATPAYREAYRDLLAAIAKAQGLK